MDASSKKWQAANKEKHLASHRKYIRKHKEEQNVAWRKRYQKRKEAFEKRYGSMARNIRNERLILYRSDKEYFKEQLQGIEKERNLAIAYDYLDGDKTLYETGHSHHISKERVRQCIAKILFKVVKIDLKRNKNMASIKNKPGYTLFKQDPTYWEGKLREEVFKEDHQAPQLDVILRFFRDDEPVSDIVEKTKYGKQWVYEIIEKASNYIENGIEPASKKDYRQNPLRQEEFDQIKALSFQGEEVKDIAHQIKRSKFVVQRVRNATSLADYFARQKAWYLQRSNTKAMKIHQEVMGTEVVFHGALPNSPSPHRQALADAIDAFIKEEVKIQVQMKLDKIKESL